jgi:YedE family putative selenium metabolism protein
MQPRDMLDYRQNAVLFFHNAARTNGESHMRGKTEKRGFPVVLAGAAIGALAVLLCALGNPANMGLSVACFLRDTAGALGLHSAQSVQYVRPELTGVVLGSMLAAALRREFRPRGGSSPVTRFVVALVVMIGAMVFLGCPLRMLLRIGGGDLNAVVGLGGFAAGGRRGVPGGVRCFTAAVRQRPRAVSPKRVRRGFAACAGARFARRGAACGRA